MTLADIVKQSQKFTIDNSPLILTAIGAGGVVMTGILTAVATSKSIVALEEHHQAPWLEVPFEKEDVRVVWQYWVPPLLIGAGSVACIVGANRIGTRRAAALAVAYGLSERAFAEYQEKVFEQFGKKKEENVRVAVAQDRIDRDPISTREVVITGNGDVMCYESLTGRYFLSNVEAIRSAENKINKQILDSDYATLSDFFDHIGLTGTEYSQEVGWNPDRMLEVKFSTVLSEDGKPCVSVHYAMGPIRDYFRRH